METLLSVLEHHTNRLFEASSVLHSKEQFPPNWHLALQRSFQELETFSHEHLSPALEGSCHSLRAFIAELAKQQNPPSPEECQLILQKCDEIRLHALASALFVLKQNLCSGSELDPSVEKVLRHKLLSSACAVTLEPSGLFHTEIFNQLILVLPSTHSYEDVHDLLTELAQLYESTQSGMSWIIDCSALREVNEHLLRTLLSYQMQLREDRRSEIELCWLSQGVLNSELGSALRQYFDLTENGGHWFSRGLTR